MTRKSVWFVRFDANVKSKVKFANDRGMKVEGMGDVVIQRKDGEYAMIRDVLYIQGMKSNLLSIGQLLEKDYKVIIEDKLLRLLCQTIGPLKLDWR